MAANLLVIVRESACHDMASSAIGRRDGGTVCDTDRCCPPGQFCAAISLICAPCAAHGAGTPDLLPPELLWLLLTPGAVDASVASLAWQPVEHRFGGRVR